jgi:hypothetical protein
MPGKLPRASRRFPEALTIHLRNVSKFIVFGTTSPPESPRTSEAQIRGLLAKPLAEADVIVLMVAAPCERSGNEWAPGLAMLARGDAGGEVGAISDAVLSR